MEKTTSEWIQCEQVQFSQVASFRALMCGILLSLGSLLTAYGESGILVWKSQPFHADTAANATIYNKVESIGPMTRFSSNGQKLSFNTGQYFRHIAFPDQAMIQFTEDADYVEMQRSYQELAGFAKQYAKAEPLLVARLEHMTKILKGYKDGKVYYDAKWMPRAEYISLFTTQKEANTLKKKQANAKENQKRKVIIIGVLTFTILLIITLVLRKWKGAGLLLLIPLVGAGWLTYKENGYEWSKKIPEHLVLPSDWQPFLQKYLDKLNLPK